MPELPPELTARSATKPPPDPATGALPAPPSAGFHPAGSTHAAALPASPAAASAAAARRTDATGPVCPSGTFPEPPLRTRAEARGPAGDTARQPAPDRPPPSGAQSADACGDRDATQGGIALRCAFTPDAPAYDAQVDALFARAFGPGRFAKTAARLREDNAPLRELSRIAWQDGRLVGAARVWPISAGPRKAVFFGPFAVDETLRGRGVGLALARLCCEAAALDGQTVMVLIGAAAFFYPLGFTPAPPGRLRLPGPVDPARLLWRALDGGDLDDVAGPVQPGWSASTGMYRSAPHGTETRHSSRADHRG